MSVMQQLADSLHAQLGATAGVHINNALGELTLTVPSAGFMALMRRLRDDDLFRFEQLLDIAGMDYSEYAGRESPAAGRYAAVYHLLSLHYNHRLRVRVFCLDDTFPQLDSVCDLWSSADWYEREAFDLFGIVFHGHRDLRRILTDYGFVGHPFRKDFPISGHVEMRYDADKKRVIYVPVSIEPREVTPRIVREESFGRGRDG